MVWWDLGESLGLPSVPARTQGMGRTVGQQWYGGTEGNPCDSLQSLPGLRGWGELWDSSGMVGFRGWEGLWDSSGMVGLREVPRTPFHLCQDSGDGKDCGTAVVWWD